MIQTIREAIYDALHETGFDYDAAAQAVVAALQLTEEHRTLTDGWIQPARNAWYYAQGLEPPPAVITHETRLVSPWVELVV